MPKDKHVWGANSDSPDTSTSPDFKMQPEEFGALREQVRSISLVDTQLGRVLENVILHLGHLHGFDPVQEDEKAKAQEDAQAQKDAQVQESAQTSGDNQSLEGGDHAN